MPFIQDVVGQEVQQIKNIKTGVTNSVKSAGAQIANGVKNQALGAVNSVVNNGIKAATGAAVGAVTSALTGNLAGVAASLNPTNILDQTFSGIIGQSTSSTTTEPGYAFSASSSGGVNPGDALNGALARADPMLTYLWYVQLPVVGAPAGSTGSGVNSSTSALSSLVSNLLGISPLSGSMGGEQASGSNNQLPWYYVEEANCPFRNFQLTSVFRDGRKRHYPGQYTVGNLRLSFYMDVDNVAANYISAWGNTILQPYTAATLSQAGNFGRASGYKFPIYVYLLDPAKNTLITLEYTECFPILPNDWQLTSQSGTDRLITQVNFSVGDVFVNMANVPSSLTSLLVNNALTNTVVSGINSGFASLAKSAINAVA